MPSSIFYRGQNLYDPQTVVDINNQLLKPTSLGDKNLCVVGNFPHLEPQKTYVFKSTGGASVAEIFPTKTEMHLLDHYWKNSIRQGQGVSTSLSFVNACDPTTNLQASKALQNIDRAGLDGADSIQAGNGFSGAVADVITLKAASWGDDGNNVSIDISVNNPVDLDSYWTVVCQVPGQDEVSLSTGSGGVLEVKSSAAGELAISRVKTSRTCVWTPNGGAAQTIQLDELTNMKELRDQLNTIAGLTATVLNFDFKPFELDAMNVTWSSGGAANANYPAQFRDAADSDNNEAITLGAQMQSLANFINTVSSIPATATIDLYDHDVEAGANNLASGANGGEPDASDYAAALAAIVDKDIQLISCLLKDDDALRRSVAGKMFIHIGNCLDASRDRQAIMPCDEDTTISDAHDLYVRPNSSAHISFVAQNLELGNPPFGGSVRKGNEWTAFLIMCMQGALPYAEPITRKRPNITNTYENWDRDLTSNKNLAIRKNLVIVSLGLNGELYVNRGVTSWIEDNDTINMEMSARESVLGCARFMRITLENEIGGKILSSTKDSLISIANKRLLELKVAGIIKEYGNITVAIVADTANVAFDIAPVNPLNFIRVTINVVDEI